MSKILGNIILIIGAVLSLLNLFLVEYSEALSGLEVSLIIIIFALIIHALIEMFEK